MRGGIVGPLKLLKNKALRHSAFEGAGLGPPAFQSISKMAGAGTISATAVLQDSTDLQISPETDSIPWAEHRIS